MRIAGELVGLGLVIGFLAFLAFAQKREVSHTINYDIANPEPVLRPGEYYDAQGRRCFGNVCLAKQ